MRRRSHVSGLCVACALTVATERVAHAETPSPWMLGEHANISADSAGDTGWLLGLGLGARHPLRPWLDLQLRVFATYGPQAWQVGGSSAQPSQVGDTAVGDGVHVLAEATARWRPWAPLFVGLGPQAGVRFLQYSEIVVLNLPEKRGTDVRPVVRGLLELGADFGPSEMFEVGVRIAVGDALGTGPVDRLARGDAELGFTLGVLACP